MCSSKTKQGKHVTQEEKVMYQENIERKWSLHRDWSPTLEQEPSGKNGYSTDYLMHENTWKEIKTQ